MSLMKVEKVPDSTYDMVGGLDKQVKEIKESKQKPNFSSRFAKLTQSLCELLEDY